MHKTLCIILCYNSIILGGSIMSQILEKNNGLDKISATNIRRNYTEASKLVKSQNKPVEITVNGKADLIVMAPEFFEAFMDMLEDYEDMITVLKHQQNGNLNDLVEYKPGKEFGEFADMSIDELLNL